MGMSHVVFLRPELAFRGIFISHDVLHVWLCLPKQSRCLACCWGCIGASSPPSPLQAPHNCSAASRWGSALHPGAAGVMKGMGAAGQRSGVSRGDWEW